MPSNNVDASVPVTSASRYITAFPITGNTKTPPCGAINVHLKSIDNHQGIAFLIVRFTTLNETYLLPAKSFIDYIENTDRKSIPIVFFRNNAYLIKDSYRPRIDYLKIIDILIGGK